MQNIPTLYLIPTPLQQDAQNDLCHTINNEIIHGLKHYWVENAKTARKFLKHCGGPTPLQQIDIIEYNKQIKEEDFHEAITWLQAGHNIGVMSEAGCPAVADPGTELVALAHKNNIKVVPLIGPNSIIMALMASGLNGQSFVFHGYLPINSADKATKLKEIERQRDYTHIFIETPFRNNAMVDVLLRSLQPYTRLCIAAHINSPEESINTKTIKQWQIDKPTFEKIPIIYLIGK